MSMSRTSLLSDKSKITNSILRWEQRCIVNIVLMFGNKKLLEDINNDFSPGKRSLEIQIVFCHVSGMFQNANWGNKWGVNVAIIVDEGNLFLHKKMTLRFVYAILMEASLKSVQLWTLNINVFRHVRVGSMRGHTSVSKNIKETQRYWW